MVSKLQCEICGGKLVGKPGGIFECENCGTEYSTEWAKAKIQEITGTVKVEGTVQVQGTVKVENGGPSAESLVKRGMIKLDELRSFTGGIVILQDRQIEIEKLFNRALEINPECAEAYWGLFLLKNNYYSSKEALLEASTKTIEKSVNYRHAREYAKGELAKLIFQIEARLKQENQEKVLASSMTSNRLNLIRQRFAPASKMISAGSYHAIALKTDGTVVATQYIGDKRYNFGQCDVGDWTDVVMVTAGWEHTVGLKENGDVLAVGNKEHGRCDVGNWRNIVAIAAGAYHTVGLKADGTVVAVGSDDYGQCQVSAWRDIVAVAAGDSHTIGLKTDGTVVAVGNQLSGACKVEGWRNIVAIAASTHNSVGLKADGTVITVGRNISGKCNVEGWKDIVAIAAGFYHTVGLKANGTVVAVGGSQEVTNYGQCEVKTWSDVVAVAASSTHTVGLKGNGTVISTKYTDSMDYYHGQGDVNGWKLFNNVDTIESERKTAMELAKAKREAVAEEARIVAEKTEVERKEKIEALTAETDKLQAELPNLKGLFSGGKRRQIEARLAEIEAELKELE